MLLQNEIVGFAFGSIRPLLRKVRDDVDFSRIDVDICWPYDNDDMYHRMRAIHDADIKEEYASVDAAETKTGVQ